MTNDATVLRRLAYEYARLAEGDRNRENLSLHAAVNDLRMVRPVVLIDEIPWHEFDPVFPEELALRCEDPYLQEVERYFRRTLFKARRMPADMVLRPHFPVHKVIGFGGDALEMEERVLATDDRNHIVSHEYVDVLRTEADLARIRPSVVAYDREETMRRFELVGGILGDLLPVRLVGVDIFYIVTWDDVSRYRGVTDLLMDLAERPDFSHAVARALTDRTLSMMAQVEALGLIDPDPYALHCTAGRTSDLPGKDYDGGKATRKDIWGRGAAQIFASVSPSMHEEFDIEYMKETIGTCGLAYYGCCEPLDRKIDVVARIPNLRKISITPWADVDVAAEAIGRKYVLASKPTPSSVAVPRLDEEALRKELGRILDAVRRNGCSCDLVLKDISTCGGRPENLFAWERTAMEMVRAW